MRDDAVYSLNDDSALIDLYKALSGAAMSGAQVSVAVRLIRKGWPATFAVRVACTPSFRAVPNGELSDAHEGRELAEAVDALVGDVAAAITYWGRWVS